MTNPSIKETTCPICEVDWIETAEMLQAPSGSEAYTMAARILGYCERQCKTSPYHTLKLISRIRQHPSS